jgi:acylphosphatase
VRIARRFYVSGRVQGVGYRMFVESAAAHEGIHGWIQNLADGRVEILAEGELESLQRFEVGVRQGPRRADVAQVDVSDEPPSGRSTGFLIK